MLMLLSEMVFSPPYEQYVINFANKIFKEDYMNIKPLFEKKIYAFKEIFQKFVEGYPGVLEKIKRKLNNSQNSQSKNQSSNWSINISGIENINRIDRNLSDSKTSNKGSSLINVKLNKTKDENEIKLSFSKSKTENPTKKKKVINDFSDTLNFRGNEFETHIQILLSEILFCFQKEANSFKFQCNLKYNIKQIYKGIENMEFDFVISSINNTLFEKFIQYLKKNILFAFFLLIS